MKSKIRQILFAAGLLICVSGATTFAQTNTEFTYQGKLSDGGVPANGNYDIEFKIYDCATCNPQEGVDVFPISIVKLNVPVTNGVFTVGLDYGEVFNGLPTWIRIAIRPAGVGGLTILDPRQKINSVPNAIYSVAAGTASESLNSAKLDGHLAAEFVLEGDPRLSDARQPTSDFTISGTGTATAFNATTQFNIGGSRVLSVSGTENLFVGISSGAGNTSGSSNSFAGFSSGSANTTGQNNSFFGSRSGMTNGAGQGNSYFGSRSGSSAAGSNNSYFGNEAGQNSASIDSSFFGYQSGKINTGINNSFFGANTGVENSNGDFNTFVGESAGRFNTTGFTNAFVGYHAGYLNTTGSANSYFGVQAGAENNVNSPGTGSGNSFFGYASGKGTISGFNNTYLGSFSGGGSLGGNNTAIGAEALIGSSTLSNATAIGFQSSVTQDDSLVLGRINGVNGSTADTKVGIGITAPNARLHVQNGHVYVGSPGQGMILKSPNGAICRLFSIDNAGAMVLTPIACP